MSTRIEGLPTVEILATGGTIATRVDPLTKKAEKPLSGAELAHSSVGMERIANVLVKDVFSTASSDITPQLWARLLAEVRTAVADSRVDAVVITHGTDTLEETAYFLDLTVATDKPVVIVGAQKMASDPASDGPENLRQAIAVAASASSRGRGVLVVLDGAINAAREVAKTSTVALDAFKSLEFGPLGTVAGTTVRYTRPPPQRRQTLPFSGGTLPRVEIVLAYAGADGSQIRSLISDPSWPQHPLDGLVVAAAGLGHVSSSMFDEIERARSKGLPVVIASRVYTGPTKPLYPGKGLGQSLKKIGCIFVNDLSPVKARILLMLALTQTTDSARIQQQFDQVLGP